MKSTTASSKKGNLRGSGSASSTAPPEDYKPDEDENKPDTTPLKPIIQIVKI